MTAAHPVVAGAPAPGARPASTGPPAESHLVPVAGTGWHAWRWALLRSAGFPADGVGRLGAPGCAQAADGFLAGAADEAVFGEQFAGATAATARAVHDIACDPSFRTAVTWQNPGAAAAVAATAATGPGPRRTAGVRRREELIGKYWQRYCAKNDTIGFFGPVCWVSLDPAGPPVRGHHGPSLVRQAHVFFERWALAAFAEQIAADPAARPSLPLSLYPGDSLAGGRLMRPSGPPETLSGAERELLAHADGRRPAWEVARQLTGAQPGWFRREADVYALAGRAAERGMLRWGIDLPMNLTAEAALREHIERITDPAARARFGAAFGRLQAARDAVAAATAPEELGTALARLDEEFSSIAAHSPRRNPGAAFGGRTPCYLDTTRDLDLTLGGAVLAKLAPLEPLLLSARWLTAEVASAAQEVIAEIYRDLAAGAGTAEVPFSQLWFLALGPLLGEDAVPERVISEFTSRWSAVLGLAEVPAATSKLSFSAAELLAVVRQTFPATGPGWAAARIHSPDLHICAPSWDAVQRGEFTVVLGELHIGLAAFDTHFFTLGHPSPGELTAAMLADVPGSRVRLLTPDDWPRLSARYAEWMIGAGDIQLGFAGGPGAEPARLVPVTALTAVPGDGGLEVRAGDGRRWPVIDLFAGLLSMRVFDAWKLAGSRPHTPRVDIDGLVVIRETWRTTVAGTGLAAVSGERERYLAVREWRQRLGLGDRVFVLIGTESKPCYFDLTSPLYARILCGMIRSAHHRGGPATPVTITEVLPGPEHAWLTDGNGTRYSSELRLHLRDPRRAGSG